MSPNLYDLLDVDESATRDEIRAAWKAATADLDPTDRRFRAYNDAAAVLLDAESRAAYDVELAAARGEDVVVDARAGGSTVADEDEPATEPVTGPATEPVTGPATPIAPAPVRDEDHAVAEPDEPDVPDEPAGTDDDATTTTPATPESGDADGPPAWALLAGLAVAAVSLVLLVVVLLLPGSVGGEAPKERAERADDGAASAEAAAEELVPVVLAYDYRTLDADIDRASSYLTDEFAAERGEFFDKPVVVDGEPVTVDGEELTFREQVVTEKLVVAAAVSGTGLTRISENGDVATVVAYIDQESRKGDAAPQPLRMWATLRLEREDDRWLLDDICTEQDCS